MMFGETTTTTLSEHLHKLVGVKSEQELESLLHQLWRTRKTGLSATEKASFQSLLNIPSPGELDPLLASLRSLIRNCVHKNLEDDDILKLFPSDLPMELQSMFLILLRKNRSQWKRVLSQEQCVLGQTRFSHQINGGHSAPLLLPEVYSSLLSVQADQVPLVKGRHFGSPTSIAAEKKVGSFPQSTLQNDVVPTEILGVFPRVKSMTWTVEDTRTVPANRVAIITLKLQDYTKSRSNETEVTFQLTRDALEAVLRSMAYINDQLSRSVGSSRVPLQKKQRQ